MKKSRIDEDNWGETALTFLFFFLLLSFIVYFSFSNFIRFLPDYETHLLSRSIREKCWDKFFLSAIRSCWKNIYIFYIKETFYLIKKNTKLTAFLVETNNLLNGILSYFLFSLSLSLFHRSDIVLAWSFFLRDINLSQEKLKKKKKEISKRNSKRISKRTEGDFMDILKPLAALFQVGSLLV